MQMRIKPGLVAMVGVAALTLTTSPVWAGGETAVTGSASVVRTVADTATLMPYVVVQDSVNTIKFEDASIGLGENGAIESDLFVIEVENAGDSVCVETKAGRDSAEWVSGESDYDVDSNGFRIELVSISGTTYTLRVSSTPDVVEALSHVTFTFHPGQLADAMYD